MTNAGTHNAPRLGILEVWRIWRIDFVKIILCKQTKEIYSFSLCFFSFF